MHPIFIVAIVAVVVWGITEIVRIGTRYSENVERMKNGYPLKDGTKPFNAKKEEDELDKVLQ